MFQTAPPSRVGSSHPEPADAIVQTDQRIVFQGDHQHKSDKIINFDDDDNKMSNKNSWSQTYWKVQDNEIQVSSSFSFDLLLCFVLNPAFALSFSSFPS